MFTFRCRELNACPTVRSENVCVIRGLWKIGEEGGGGNIHIFVVLLLVVLCLHYACICEHEYMNTAPPPIHLTDLSNNLQNPTMHE